MSGSGIVSDGPGSILFTTGNGGSPTTPAAGSSPPATLGESAVRLAVQPGGTLKAVSFFAPYNAKELDEKDLDFASSGISALSARTIEIAAAIARTGAGTARSWCTAASSAAWSGRSRT